MDDRALDETYQVLHGTSEVAASDPGGGPVTRAPRGAIVVRAGRVLETGSAEDLLRRHPRARPLDAGGRLVTPGLIDCHTHMLFAGHRALEFQERLAGASYAAIAARGGGIQSTVRATAAASDEALVGNLLGRLDRWLSAGATTVEVKSGYGLTPESELRLLHCLAAARRRTTAHLHPTALLLHALPAEWGERRSAYVEAMSALLPEILRSRLANAVDVYCDEVGFTTEECRALLHRARELGLLPRVHAEQFGRTGGAPLAAELGARAADHLECASEDDWGLLARAGVVAVLLPAAALTLGQALPKASLARAAGARVAIATDFNPGTSPAQSLLECAALAARLSGFSPEEALLALTWNAARALGLEAEVGHLGRGARADLVIWDCETLEELTYWMPATRAAAVLVDGRVVGATAPVG